MLGKRKKTRLLVLEDVADAPAIRILRPRTPERDALGPLRELRVQIGDARVPPRREEGVA